MTFDLPTEKEIAEHREAMRYWDEEEAEFKRIKNSVPLGAARHVEPRSIHSPLHTPAWKRKLRP